MFDVRERVEPVVPPVWETVLEKYVLLVDGPMNSSVLPWPSGVKRFVISGVPDGYYVLSEGEHFGVWNEASDEGE